MMIDAHVHFFPDSLATRTLERLSAIANTPYFSDGTLSGTLCKMDEWGIDQAVALHIAVKPGQQRTVNAAAVAAQKQSGGRIWCAGSVHPDAPDALDELQYIRDVGMVGVKLHADYQGFFFDEERLDPLYACLEQLGLPLVVHAGWDPLSPDLAHANPARIGAVARRFPGLRIVAAHMGGFRMLEEVISCLERLPNVWLDTALATHAFPDAETMAGLIRRHGVERVLFATDCPWDAAPLTIQFIRDAGFTAAEQELLFYKNAQILFALPQ